MKFLPKLGYVSSSEVAIQDAYHRRPLDTYKISLLLLTWQGRLKVQSDILSVPIIIPGADDVGPGAGQVQMVTRGGYCKFLTVQGYSDLDRVWKVEERELEGVSLLFPPSPPSFFSLLAHNKVLQLKIFETGERLMGRIEFGELALKGLDPSLGPSIFHVSSTEKKLRVCTECLWCSRVVC